MNSDVQSDLSTLYSKNGEQLEDFHGRVLIIQQEIILSGEIVSPTRLLFQYMKTFSNSDKLISFIAPNMTDLITFLDNKVKYSAYTGGDIHGINCYLEIIGSPTKLDISGQSYHPLNPSSSIKNDAATIQPVIAAICTRQKSICECCGRIGHKSNACIIRDTKLLPPSLRRKMN